MYKLLLCLRYLRSRYIAMASIISVMLGVATMIVVNSVMAGFSTEMRDRIHGILADVLVESTSYEGIEDPQEYMELIREVAGDYVEGMAGTVEVYGMLNFKYADQWATHPITLIGIAPEEKSKVGPLVDYLDSYNPVVRNGKVERPPLRSRDVPPGWELTDDAKAYRRMKAEHRAWLDKYNPAEWPPPSNAQSDVEHLQTESGTEPMALEPRPFIEDEGETVPVFAESAPIDDPFEAFWDTAEPVDPAEPMKARIYLAYGLAGFNFYDASGATRWMDVVKPGDNVKISTISASVPPRPVDFDATVVDLFKTGMSEYDQSLVYCNIEALQQYRGMVDPTSQQASITSIQIKLKEFVDSDVVVQRLRSVFPPGHFEVRTWEQKQGPLLAAVEIESAILNVLLFLIITVAGFGILAIFFMIVVEKTRDIGILKALGASSRGVMSIFLSYGLALGIVGSGVGVVMGLLFVKYINVIESWITWLTGRKVFDETIYYFPQIPTDVQPAMVIWVAIGAMTIAVLASILPARRAARLHPVEALRYE